MEGNPSRHCGFKKRLEETVTWSTLKVTNFRIFFLQRNTVFFNFRFFFSRFFSFLSQALHFFIEEMYHQTRSLHPNNTLYYVSAFFVSINYRTCNINYITESSNVTVIANHFGWTTYNCNLKGALEWTGTFVELIRQQPNV